MIKRYFFLVGILISCISIENIAKNNNNQPSRIYTLPKGATENDYLPKTIVFKVNNLESILKLQIIKIAKKISYLFIFIYFKLFKNKL